MEFWYLEGSKGLPLLNSELIYDLWLIFYLFTLFFYSFGEKNISWSKIAKTSMYFNFYSPICKKAIKQDFAHCQSRLMAFSKKVCLIKIKSRHPIHV